MNNHKRNKRMVIPLSLLFYIAIVLFSCSSEPAPVENKPAQPNTLQTDFVFAPSSDSIIQNGEYINYYKNGVMEMRGIMKDGERDGLWKSWYEDGSPWSETTFANGKKNGKTTTWYDNEKKRYEGFYTNDKESGSWIFWDESGKEQSRKDYK